MKKLYVGNLPFDTDEEQIRDLFAQYGDVKSVDMINDRETGRFRGFCFVAMENADADKAAQALDGQPFNGRPLKVNEAKPREDRPSGGRGGSGGYGGQRQDNRSRGGYGGSRGSDRDRNRW